MPTPSPSSPSPTRPGLAAKAVLGDIVHGFWSAITTLPWWVGVLFAVVVLSAVIRFVRGIVHGGHPKDVVRRFSQVERRTIFIRAGHRCEHHIPIFGSRRCLPMMNILTYEVSAVRGQGQILTKAKLWATDASCLNDAQEMRFGRMEVVEALEREGQRVIDSEPPNLCEGAQRRVSRPVDEDPTRRPPYLLQTSSE